MKTYKVTSGGQIAVPSSVRKRWGASRVRIDDLGDHLVVRPLPDDPISEFRGAFAVPGMPSADELRSASREAERRAEKRKFA